MPRKLAISAISGFLSTIPISERAEAALGQLMISWAWRGYLRRSEVIDCVSLLDVQLLLSEDDATP